MNKYNLKNVYIKFIGLIFCFILILLSIYIGNKDYESCKVIQSLIYMVIFLVLISFNVFPIVAICLLMISFLPFTGLIDNFGSAMIGFSNPVVAFIIASFGIATALSKTSFVTTMMESIFKKDCIDGDVLVLKTMICTALMSSIVSNVPTCVLFSTIAKRMVEQITSDKKKILMKKMMIAIPLSSMIGGIMTPVGSSVNILAISILEKNLNQNITFVQWMLIGIPVAILILPICWLLIRGMDQRVLLNDKFSNIGVDIDFNKCIKKDIKTFVYILVLLFFWILSSWVKKIDIMQVTLIGCSIMCLPYIGVIKVNDLLKSINWEAVLLVGTVLSLGNMLLDNDVCSYIAIKINNYSLYRMSSLLLYGLIAFITFALLVIIPVAPSLVAFLSPLIIILCQKCGVAPVLGVTILSICACNCYLFPFDTVCLITYTTGNYSIKDLIKISLPLQISIIFICSLIVKLNEVIFWR